MAFELRLSDSLKRQGWKAKIRDKERVEPPHITIIHRTKAWRFGLRDTQFLDKEPDPGEVPKDLLRTVEEHLGELHAAWDSMYPGNPVTKEADDE